MIDDLRHFRAPDAFQFLEPRLAYDLFWVGLIILAIIL